MRIYKQKSNRETTAQQSFIDADKDFIQNGKSLRAVVSDFNVNFITLKDFEKITRENGKLIIQLTYIVSRL